MNNKIKAGIVFLPFCFIWLLYAANTIRVTVPETTNDTSLPKSYANQEIYIQSWSLQLVNLNNDDSLVWDYFSGFYHDSAYWAFEMQFRDVSWSSWDTQWVSISNMDVSDNCTDSTSHRWYKLIGFSYNREFWAMDFAYDNNNYAYICVPRNENSDEVWYLWWNAYSELMGSQNFGGIELDVFVDRTLDHSSDVRFVRVDWIASSQNADTDDGEYDEDIRILWNIQTSTLRKDILQNVFDAIIWSSIDNGIRQVTALHESKWSNTWWGTILQKGQTLYFWDLNGDQVRVAGTNNLWGIKTLVVEWGDIFIDANITDVAGDNDIMWMIAIEKWWVGWNIIIDSDVTDLHVVMYTDRAILSSVWWNIADWNTPDTQLANQLYIKWSVFSKNTIWWALNSPYECPFYEQNICNEVVAKKYDLGFLRRYILVSEVDAAGEPTWVMLPSNGGAESEMGDGDNTNTASQSWKSWYRVYPIVIEYNPLIQTAPPPFFWN